MSTVPLCTVPFPITVPFSSLMTTGMSSTGFPSSSVTFTCMVVLVGFESVTLASVVKSILSTVNSLDSLAGL